MEALKLKIFEVIGSRIAIEEFEKWLYGESNILKSIDSNTTIFDVITLNYKKSNCLAQLLKLSSDLFTYEEYALLRLVHSCRKIISTKSKSITFKEIYELNRDFNFETEYRLIWLFYTLNEQIDLSKNGLIKELITLKTIRNHSQTVISKFRRSSSLSEMLEILHYEY